MNNLDQVPVGDYEATRLMPQHVHLSNGGCKCPRCRSTQIEGGFVETGAGQAKQEMRCLVCGFSWTDVYQLWGYEVDEPKSGAE